MDEWTDAVRIAVDIFVACVIIAALLLCITLGGNITRFMDNSYAAAADVKDYRVANMYEGTDVYSQDVINVIITNQGMPAVKVLYNQGGIQKEAVWNSESYATQLTSASIGNHIGVAKTFKCTLEYDATGAIQTYVFEEV